MPPGLMSLGVCVEALESFKDLASKSAPERGHPIHIACRLAGHYQFPAIGVIPHELREEDPNSSILAALAFLTVRTDNHLP
ncbi:hypothetical protein [Planctomicrobium sp. SH527]|uniref:hypothetical protein n=1 Tax=Planctomicrobium sp. SH527 TaxID=3448123 RepID=UPI003F5B21C5